MEILERNMLSNEIKIAPIFKKKIMQWINFQGPSSLFSYKKIFEMNCAQKLNKSIFHE